MASLGWRYFLVFACLTVVSIIVVYFCKCPCCCETSAVCLHFAVYPETKQKSLEELAAYFSETVITDEGAKIEHEKGSVDVHTEVI